jgi:hypothetical protein
MSDSAQEITHEKNPAAVELGRLGGRVKGVSKRRIPAHYKRISRLGVAARIAANRERAAKERNAQGVGV